MNKIRITLDSEFIQITLDILVLKKLVQCIRKKAKEIENADLITVKDRKPNLPDINSDTVFRLFDYF